MLNMASPRSQSQIDDLQTSTNLKRIDDLEGFRKEFEGKEFDKKVLQSVKESHLIREEISDIVWKTIKNKIVWIILGLFGLVTIEVIYRLIPILISHLKPN